MNIRKALDESPKHDFYLVGSQMLGTARPDSDWDYVVTAEEGVIAFLRHLGFKSLMGATETDDGIDEENVYGDNDRYVKAIVQVQCPETRVTVQVAIVADAHLKLRIMETLKKNKLLRDYDLSLHGTKDRNRLWDAMYALTGWTGASGNECYVQGDERKFKPNAFLVDDDISF